MRNLVNSNCMRKAPEKEGKLTDPKMAFIGHETHGYSPMGRYAMKQPTSQSTTNMHPLGF